LRAWFPFALVLTCSLTAPSQSVPAASPPDSAPTLKVDVKLVPVHVVVRDAQGQTVGNLGKDDFQVFDQGKEQVITQFSVEEASKGKGAPSNPIRRGPWGSRSAGALYGLSFRRPSSRAQ
jgi:hypothetical protein